MVRIFKCIFNNYFNKYLLKNCAADPSRFLMKTRIKKLSFFVRQTQPAPRELLSIMGLQKEFVRHPREPRLTKIRYLVKKIPIYRYIQINQVSA